MELARLAPVVEEAMRATRARVLAAYARPPEVEAFKDDGSAVTALDHALERELAAVLLGLAPRYGVRSEESGELRAGTPTWHLDPLDGSANFARRLSVFASQLALCDEHRPLFAAVYEPLTDLFTWAALGAGTWHQGRRVRVAQREPGRAVVHVDVARSGLFAARPEILGAVRQGCYKVRALGSVAVHLRDIAVGAADAYLGGRAEASPLHDMAPGVLLIREAGGTASDGAGGDPLAERRTLVAGGAEVHDWLCGLLAGA